MGTAADAANQPELVRLSHASGTGKRPAPGGYGWRVNHCATVTTRPSCVPAAGANLVTDEHPARPLIGARADTAAGPHRWTGPARRPVGHPPRVGPRRAGTRLLYGY